MITHARHWHFHWICSVEVGRRAAKRKVNAWQKWPLPYDGGVCSEVECLPDLITHHLPSKSKAGWCWLTGRLLIQTDHYALFQGGGGVACLIMEKWHGRILQGPAGRWCDRSYLLLGLLLPNSYLSNRWQFSLLEGHRWYQLFVRGTLDIFSLMQQQDSRKWTYVQKVQEEVIRKWPGTPFLTIQSHKNE